MDKISSKVVAILDSLEKISPVAFQHLVEAAKIEGMLGVVGIVAMAVIVLIAFAVFSWSIRKISSDKCSPAKEQLAGTCAFSGFCGLIALLILVGSLFGSDTILKVSNPEAFVVKDLLTQARR